MVYTLYLVAMIYSVSGTLKIKARNFAVVEVGGIGLKISVSLRTREKLPPEGERVTLSTYLYVREDALELFGFADAAELDCFEALTSVSGVGPRLALALLAVAPVQELVAAIAKGEAELLDRAAGIGRKTAERIILELKDRMRLVSGGGPSLVAFEADEDIFDALRSLGYSLNQTKSAIAKIDPGLKDVGDRLRDALKKIKG
jgi:Holliday junction DNA helicase RuvA